MLIPAYLNFTVLFILQLLNSDRLFFNHDGLLINNGGLLVNKSRKILKHGSSIKQINNSHSSFHLSNTARHPGKYLRSSFSYITNKVGNSVNHFRRGITGLSPMPRSRLSGHLINIHVSLIYYHVSHCAPVT